MVPQSTGYHSGRPLGYVGRLGQADQSAPWSGSAWQRGASRPHTYLPDLMKASNVQREASAKLGPPGGGECELVGHVRTFAHKPTNQNKLVRTHGPQHQKSQTKTNIQQKSIIFLEFRAENPFSEVPKIERHVLGYSGSIFETCSFFDIRPTGQQPNKCCRNCYLFPFP